VAVALSSPGGGELVVADLQVLGHLFFEDLLEDGLDALANPGLHVVVELTFRGQVVSLLTQPTTYQTLSFEDRPGHQAYAFRVGFILSPTCSDG
jgi:hypothetical protein